MARLFPENNISVTIYFVAKYTGDIHLTIEHLIARIKGGTNHKYLYHFSERSNLHSIKENGILSKKTMEERDINAVKPGGNQWSWDADKRKGLDGYVNLCFTTAHPMREVAKNDGRLSDAPYIAIKPEILLLPNIKIAFDVANKRDIEIFNLGDELDQIDQEVLYDRTNWKDAQIQRRLKAVEKYEILIPNEVPREYLIGLMKA